MLVPIIINFSSVIYYCCLHWYKNIYRMWYSKEIMTNTCSYVHLLNIQIADLVCVIFHRFLTFDAIPHFSLITFIYSGECLKKLQRTFQSLNYRLTNWSFCARIYGLSSLWTWNHHIINKLDGGYTIFCVYSKIEKLKNFSSPHEFHDWLYILKSIIIALSLEFNFHQTDVFNEFLYIWNLTIVRFLNLYLAVKI